MARSRNQSADAGETCGKALLDRLMGEAFSTGEQRVVRAGVIGTPPLSRIVLVENDQIVYKVGYGTKEIEFEYRDDGASVGANYHYTRAEQSDGSLPWSSPIWVKRR